MKLDPKDVKLNHIYKATPVRVVDGDTIFLRVDVGFYASVEIKFRLARINAPELTSPDPVKAAAAVKAKDFLQFLVNASPQLLIQSIKTDEYGRWIADIFTVENGPGNPCVNLNDSMVMNGHAVPYTGGKIVK